MNCPKPFSMSAVTLVLLFVVCVPNGRTQHRSPRYGTWKLNIEKSAFSAAPPPKYLTRTDEPAGDGVKVTYEGMEADGSRIAYSYMAQYDGKEYRPSGVGMANGWETITLKRIDDYTWEATLRRAGKVVTTTKNVVSRDGKTMTQTVNGRSVSIWERQ